MSELPVFSQAVTDFWIPVPAADAATRAGEYRVVIDGSRPGDVPLMTLETSERGRFLTMSSAAACRLGLADESTVGEATLRSALEATGEALHDPDYLFYLPIEQQRLLLAESVPGETRQLSEADAEGFEQFGLAAPAKDMEEAFIELEHWLVFGTFEEGRLASVASMYPWRDTPFADIGVITLPEYRSRGLARRAVRAISARALMEGYEPQYRCQLDNYPSVSLAEAAGFARFGTWAVIVSGDDT